MTRLRCAAALLLLCGPLACDELPAAQSSAPIAAPQASDEGLPEPVVELPDVPPLTMLDEPRAYEDGSLTVAGLLLERERYRGQDVVLTAVLDEIYICETARPDLAEEEAEPDPTLELSGRPTDGEEAMEDTRPSRAGCRLPHFYAVDNVRSDQRMLVVGYDWTFYEPQLERFAQYRIEGRYAQRAMGFTSTEEGLIIATQITGDTITFPEEAVEEPTE